jgi:hypothetical protein
MGSTPSVAVIHTSKLQDDQQILMAVFRDKFQVESQQNSRAVLLVEEQLTLVLIPCTAAKGTYATLVLEEDLIRQAADRAVIYGVDMQEQALMDTIVLKLVLPGGATLVATTADLWKTSSARSVVMDHVLALPTVGNGNGNGIQNTKSPPLTRHSISVMKHSMSMPNFPPFANISAPSTSTNNSRLFPSLHVQALQHEGRFTNLLLNSQLPVPVETELFVGNLLLTMRPNNPQDDPYWNDKIFSKKKRRVVMQLQGKLKYKPKGVVYAGMEVSDPMKLGLLASG